MMDLLKKLNEDAAGGACGGGSVAGFATPLFMTLNNSKKKKPKSIKQRFKNLGEQVDPEFEDTEVISKLKSLEHKAAGYSTGAANFGLENDDGGIVRVSVQADQADEFEQALQAFLADENENQHTEIAEILFKLRSHFNILDVQWPEVEEDQEETQLAQPDGGVEQGEGDAVDGVDGQLDDPAMTDGADDADTKSLLGQVIDMMRADADARKADAVARQKEAEMKATEFTNATASSKVKREEELLDMDSYYKDKKAAEREAKQLAKLAQWKQETGGDAGVEDELDFGPMPGDRASHEENEEHTTKILRNRGKVHPSDVADFILNRIKK